MEFNSGWYMYAFFGNTGLKFGINEDGVTNSCNWNSKKGKIKGVDILDSLLDVTSSKAFLNLPDGEFPAKIKSGEVIAGISGVWNVMSVKEAWGDDYGAVKLPTFQCAGQKVQMSSFTGYKMMGVNYYSKEPEWAAKFADWITNEENQSIRFTERNQGPSNINASQSDEVAKVAAIQAVIDQSQYGNLQRVGNNYWAPAQTFGETIAARNPEGKELQELMDVLVEGITASAVQ
jgi:arabinogalactan oligomer/maltooligosaccharide transport system substrate-binding protein